MCDGEALGKVFSKVLMKATGPAGGSGSARRGQRTATGNHNKLLVFRAEMHGVCAGASAGRGDSK